MTKLRLVAGTTMKDAGQKKSCLKPTEIAQAVRGCTAETDALAGRARRSRKSERAEGPSPEATPQIKSTSQVPDIVATDAVEIAFAALDEYPRTKTDKGLRAVRDLLWAAMVHSGHDGGTSESRQAFYASVADLACDSTMSWHCTMTSELLAAFGARAKSGNSFAKRLVENFDKSGLRTV